MTAKELMSRYEEVREKERKYYEENKEKPTHLAAMSGIATIMPDTITLLTEIVEFKDEIDVERAKAAKERAIKRLEEKLESTDMARASKALKRAEARIEVAGLKE